MLDNIAKIDDKIYKYLSSCEQQGALLSFTEPRTNEFWQELNEKIFKDMGNFVAIRFHSEFMQDLSFFRFLTNVKYLRFVTYQKPDFSQFPEMNQVDALSFGWSDWSAYSLDFLQKFKNIQNLVIDGPFEDGENIAALKQLTCLTLTYNDTVPNFEFLKNLNTLRILVVKNNELVINLSPIGQLKNLLFLELYNIEKLENIDFIADMEGLVVLELTLPALKKFPKLSPKIQLKKLGLEELPLGCDLSAIAHIKSLEEFGIGESETIDADKLIEISGPATKPKNGWFCCGG